MRTSSLVQWHIMVGCLLGEFYDKACLNAEERVVLFSLEIILKFTLKRDVTIQNVTFFDLARVAIM